MWPFHRKKPEPIPEDVQRYVIEHATRIMEACISGRFEKLLPYIAKRCQCSVEELDSDAYSCEKEEFLLYPAKHQLPPSDVWPKLLKIDLFDRDLQFYHAEIDFWTDQSEPSDLSIRGEVMREEDGTLTFEMIGLQVF